VFEYIYSGLVLGNFIYTQYRKIDFSGTEVIGIFTSVALGIDAIVTPTFTGGETLHNLAAGAINMAAPETIEKYVQIAEAIGAVAGQVYQTAKNVQLMTIIDAIKETRPNQKQ